MILCPPDLELRPLQESDAEDLFRLVRRNTARLREWLPWLPPSYSLEHMRNFLARSARENASRAALATAIRHEGELCGCIALHRIDPQHRATSIGYWLDAAFEGHGIMTRACRAMVEAGFREYGLHRLEIRCATGNEKSSAIPRRLGFVEEGILREAEWLYDHWVDLRVFSMLEQDWK